MKVFIGPYKNYYNVSSVKYWYSNLRYGNEDICFDTKWDKLGKLDKFVIKTVDAINRTLDKTINKQPRRIEVKIDNYDVWSMDNTLAYIILPMLKKLKERKDGAPFVDDKDVPKELRSTSAPPKEDEYDVDGNHFNRWSWVLDEMIWAFEQKHTDWEEQYYSGECDIQSVKTQLLGEDVYQSVKGPNHTFKIDKKNMKKHHDRMKNGFRLFGKYYEGLWD
jgi:hypothetical protein